MLHIGSPSGSATLQCRLSRGAHQLADDLQLNGGLVLELVTRCNIACMHTRAMGEGCIGQCAMLRWYRYWGRLWQGASNAPGLLPACSVTCSHCRCWIVGLCQAARALLVKGAAHSCCVIFNQHVPCGTPAAYAAALSASACSLLGWYMGCHSAARRQTCSTHQQHIRCHLLMMQNQSKPTSKWLLARHTVAATSTVQ